MKHIKIDPNQIIQLRLKEGEATSSLRSALIEAIELTKSMGFKEVDLNVNGFQFRIEPTSSVDEKIKDYVASKHTDATRFLEQQEENQGLTVEYNNLLGGKVLCYFMWFEDDLHIDLMPVGGCRVISVDAFNWHRISLI